MKSAIYFVRLETEAALSRNADPALKSKAIAALASWIEKYG
jgi:hypothetical protein